MNDMTRKKVGIRDGVVALNPGNGVAAPLVNEAGSYRVCRPLRSPLFLAAAGAQPLFDAPSRSAVSAGQRPLVQWLIKRRRQMPPQRVMDRRQYLQEIGHRGCAVG